LNNIGFGILTSSIVLVASTLCLQPAIARQFPAETNYGLKAGELGSVDLSPETNSVQAHKLRLRLLTLEPGGVIELHSQDRPTILHVIKGTLTSHLQGKPEMVLRAGVGLAQGKGSDCWIQNTGNEPVEFIWLPVYESLP
jgi:quercetin dioxygenase-like cupin family protein